MTLKEFKVWYQDFIDNTSLDVLASNEWRALQAVLGSLNDDALEAKAVKAPAK